MKLLSFLLIVGFFLSGCAGNTTYVENMKPDKVKEMEFVRIDGGCYQMGQTPNEKRQLIKELGEDKYYESNYDDELPRHEVCVDTFFMSKYEVTVGQWRLFISATGYKSDAEKNAGKQQGCYAIKDNKLGWQGGYYWDKIGFSQTSDQPVACVSYNDVRQFIRWQNMMRTDKSYRLPTVQNRRFKFYRLPTEAEWEYAARGGTTTIRFWGDEDSLACDYANVSDRANGHWGRLFPCDDGYEYSSPVGRFKANNFGLFDMLGNVWEFTSDKYSVYYYRIGPRHNPEGPSLGMGCTNRGGSWRNDLNLVRAAVRNWANTGNRYNDVGFRLAISEGYSGPQF